MGITTKVIHTYPQLGVSVASKTNFKLFIPHTLHIMCLKFWVLQKLKPLNLLLVLFGIKVVLG